MLKEDRKNKEQKSKGEFKKMVDLSPTISIIVLNICGLNSLT